MKLLPPIAIGLRLRTPGLTSTMLEAAVSAMERLPVFLQTDLRARSKSGAVRVKLNTGGQQQRADGKELMVNSKELAAKS